MDDHLHANTHRLRAPRRRFIPSPPLSDRAGEVLVSAAVLGLIATIADGEADRREVQQFTRSFQHRFALGRRSALRIISRALDRIRVRAPGDLMDIACDTLNEHLDTDQRMQLFNGLAEILVADSKITDSEEFFLDQVALKLGLVLALEYHLVDLDDR